MKFFSAISKENLTKIVTLLIVASIAVLAISILTDSNDGRRQITDSDGATETALCSILSEVEGVGDVNTMIRYDSEGEVKGVIVTASGAENPIVKKNIIDGVATVFGIPVSNVVVFEKKADIKE